MKNRSQYDELNHCLLFEVYPAYLLLETINCTTPQDHELNVLLDRLEKSIADINDYLIYITNKINNF